MEKFFRLLGILLATCTLTGCPPYSETKIQTSPRAFSNVESLLSKTSTGNESLTYLNQLRNDGYSVAFRLISGSEINSINGHSGGGFRRNGSEIVIYLNNSLSETEQAHVVAHELVHVKDDFEVDQFLQSRSHIDSAAQDFIKNFQYNGTNSYDSKIVGYVLGTLFCSEVRAYTKNQSLNDQGLITNLFAKGNQLPEFIDQNYIQKFKISYGTSATSMKAWCLTFNSMTSIQNSLAW